MKIDFKVPPSGNNPLAVYRWVQEQFTYLQRYLNTGADDVIIKELHSEPDRVYTGMIVLADGADWNPDAVANPTGATSVWAYYGGTWHILG